MAFRSSSSRSFSSSRSSSRPAATKKYQRPLGKAAGHARNRDMGDYADALIALWDGQSKGTKGMIDYAKKKGLEVYVYILGQEDK